ncbi:thioredoxin domain-containing protein [Natronolimnohabitans sp. A-GB9]|uniref:DsbA family protein n=1 Tax=Natronolimnohabitans sp. A-GB9 TaxID=3069757 RepID=UPI0027B26E06|nr:thioredoxin domain-containing protein [Natronolimnohabitans sp. A-GB9]MDQ2049162.1 thioredoxin domain-containing protein [Natronolimnohabitans sp. A-GB9]
MRLTRRAVLGATAATGLGSVAGCLGSEDPPEPPVAGDPDADVTVTVYEDFACPACGAFKQNVVPVLEEDYLEPGQVRYEHRDFPLPVDSIWSWAVASAAREVFEEGGNEPFWSFSSEIYDYLGSYSYDAIESVADGLDVDAAAVRDAAEDDAHRSTIEADHDYGDSNGVRGTPTVLVDGDQVEFVDDGEFAEMALERTSAAIEDALE